MCLESIKEKEEKAIKAEEYMKTNKTTHTIISFILLLATIITLVLGIRKKTTNWLYNTKNYHDTSKYYYYKIKIGG